MQRDYCPALVSGDPKEMDYPKFHTGKQWILVVSTKSAFSGNSNKSATV